MPAEESVAWESLLGALRPRVEAALAGGSVVLFFSVCDGSRRASILHVRANSFEQAWNDGRARCLEAAAALSGAGRWLRVDMVDAVEATAWGALRARLAQTKRNYFRYGIALDGALEFAFLEGELNAHAMLYPRGDVPNAVVNEGNFLLHAKTRYGIESVDFGDGKPVWLFTTRGWFADASGVFPLIDGSGVAAGRRELTRFDGETVRSMIEGSAGHLARQVDAQGRFFYGTFPCFDRAIPHYNALRHASTLYAMVDAWPEVRTAGLRDAIERALGYLRTALVRVYRDAALPTRAFVVDEGGEIKLGANAVALLALTRHAQVFGSQEHAGLMDQLGEGILSMQDGATGRFVHVLHAEDLTVKEAHRIIYYDGEAAFALMRLYAATGAPRWLAAVELAFDHFIAAEHWRAHDHWLAYCVNELTLYRPQERYFAFGIRNVADYLDFVLLRETTFPTLLELMMASQAMLARLKRMPQMGALLAAVDLGKFERALRHRAQYLANGFFWPEWAMFFRAPHKIVRSFFIRHHGFRVRIDDVEHYLSGLVAFLRDGAANLGTPLPDTGRWTADAVLQATQGRWWRAPVDGAWRAAGASVWAPALQPGDMAFVRRPGRKGGMPPAALRQLPHRPSAIVCVEPGALPALDALVAWGDSVPVLQVQDEESALFALGEAARAELEQTGAHVVGVTGTVGKTTTVAMLAHALAACGPTGQTRASANLPLGIAWNLASLPEGVRYAVLEMAVGSMARNTALARPEVAVFTNLGAAHLEYHHSVEEVARKKARIFEGMPAHGVAVLNRDMECWGIVAQAAHARGLRVVNYGTHAESDVRLLWHDAASGRLGACVHGAERELRVGAPGRHMVLNALAVLAVAGALGCDTAPLAEALGTFQPVAGRGALWRMRWSDGRQLTVLDEAYNANPVSMAAALDLAVALCPPGARLVLVLGDMLELGAEAEGYHARLLERVAGLGAPSVVLTGPLMASAMLLPHWPEACRVVHSPRAEQVAALLERELRDGDFVLVKGSAGTRLSQVVERMRALGVPTEGARA